MISSCSHLLVDTKPIMSFSEISHSAGYIELFCIAIDYFYCTNELCLFKTNQTLHPVKGIHFMPN